MSDRNYYKGLAQQYGNDPNVLSQKVTSYANEQGHTPEYLRSLFPNDPNLSAGLFNAYAGSQGDTFNASSSLGSSSGAGTQATNFNQGNFQTPGNPIDYSAYADNPNMPTLGADALSPTGQPDFSSDFNGGNWNSQTGSFTPNNTPNYAGGDYSGEANNLNGGYQGTDYARPASDERGAYSQYPTPIPQTPGFWGAAEQQGQANADAAYDTSRLQSPDQYNPYGQQKVTYGPDGNPIVTQDFSDPMQSRFDNLNKILNDDYSPGGQLANLRQPFNDSMLDDRSVDISAGGVGGVADALWEREQPRMQQNRQQNEADLLVRGFNPGTEGYDDRMDEVSRAENDFRLGTMGMAGQEQSRLFGLQEQQRGNTIGEQQTFRNQPISEYAGLVNAMTPQMPQFQQYQGASIDAAPLFNAAGAEGNFNLGRYGTSVSGELGTRGIDASKNAANRGLGMDFLNWAI